MADQAIVAAMSAMQTAMQEMAASAKQQTEEIKRVLEKDDLRKAAGVPADRAEDKGGKVKLKPKDFEGGKKLETKENWDEWQWGMKMKIKAVDEAYGDTVDSVEKMTTDEFKRKVEERKMNGESERDAELYRIICGNVGGEALSNVRAVRPGEGLEAWRNLYLLFNARTLGGELIRLMQAIRPNITRELQKLPGAIQEWERKWDEIEDLRKGSEMMKVAVMVSMLPEEVYDSVIPLIQATQCTYTEVKEKVIGTVTGKIARMEFKSLGVGMAERQDTGELTECEVDAVGRYSRCWTCDGWGHSASVCPTRGKGGGKGKGKDGGGMEVGNQGKGKAEGKGWSEGDWGGGKAGGGGPKGTGKGGGGFA